MTHDGGRSPRDQAGTGPVAAGGDSDLDPLLQYIRDARGFDFGGYKRSTLGRRIRKRMQDVRITNYLDYRDLLESNSDEFRLLFNTVLINVTAFFRDPEAWVYVQHEIIPAIQRAVDQHDEIRVWSAGCSSGEETYTLAIVFAEALGVAECLRRVKIYGTDIDDEALKQARSGVYSAKSIEPVPPELQDKYFVVRNGGHAFRGDLRRRVIFGRHDITRDAPISRLDLLVCRNTLMYFNVEAQRQIIDRFHFGLRDGGYLFVGKAETLLSDGARFESVNMRQRVFRRRVGAAEARFAPSGPLLPEPQPARREAGRNRRVLELFIDATPVAAVAVGMDANVVLINDQARAMFGLKTRDIGRPFHELELSYRPTELRGPIEQAYIERRSIRVSNVEHRLGPEEVRYFDVVLQPLTNGDDLIAAVAIYFIDTTLQTRLRLEVKQTREDLETAYEELQSTNEELETTNEELQSSIEELETTNQELQAGNQQLATMNDEIRSRSAELDEARSYLEGVLSSLRLGVVVLDANLRVRSWSRGAENLWGLRAGEVDNQSFFELDFGLPAEAVRPLVQACLTEGRQAGPAEVQAVNRIGRSIICSVTCSPLTGHGGGVVMLLDEVREA